MFVNKTKSKRDNIAEITKSLFTIDPYDSKRFVLISISNADI